MRYPFVFLVLTLCACGIARGQVRIVTYNIAADVNGVTTPNAGTDTVLGGIGSEVVNGFARPIDVLALQETTSNSQTVTPIVNSLNSLYGAGTYMMSTFQATEIANDPTTGNGPNALVYNTHTLQLISSFGFGTLSSSGMARQEVRYQFRPIGYDSSADFYVYVGHYKASSGTTNQSRRNVEAQAVRADSATLVPGSRVIYTGDFNLTSGASEAAWSTLTAAGSGQAVDPAGSFGKTYWSESTSSISIRFDFQLNTAPTTDGHGFSLISGSYHTFGNDGSITSSKPVTDSSNKALSGLPNRSGVLSALATASDHYPVVADYRLPAKMGVSVGAVPSQVIVGASVPVNVTVTNAAPVAVAAGADGLDYTVSSSGAVSGSGSGTGLVALATGKVTTLSLDTATPGAKSGTVNASSTSQEVAAGSFTQSVSSTVLAHATPSFTSGTQSTTLSLDFGIRALGSDAPVLPFNIRNLADASGFTAGLDLDSVSGSGNTAKLTTTLATYTNQAAATAKSFNASLDTSATGAFNATYTLATSDQNLSGALARSSLSLQLHGTVAVAGDTNLDGNVDVSDLGNVASDYGVTSGATWQQGDFDGNGTVDVSDLGDLASNYGVTGTPVSGPASRGDGGVHRQGAAVPEPSALGILIAAGWWLGARRRTSGNVIS